MFVIVSTSFFAKYSINELFFFILSDSKIGSLCFLALIPLISIDWTIGFSTIYIFNILFFISNFISLKKSVLYNLL